MKKQKQETKPVSPLADLRKETLKITKITTGAKGGGMCYFSFSPTRCGGNTQSDVGTC